MITCPWCGTSYLAFQSNCKNCGGPLIASGAPVETAASTENILTPPPAPRPISKSYAWRLMSSDGWSIAAFVFGLLGVIFSAVGAGLTLGVITAFVGLPFLFLGLIFLASGGLAFVWRYQEAQMVLGVLREGAAARGQVVEIQENYSVSVNGRHPWIIRYQFQANGESQEGKVTTLNPPGQQLAKGKAVCVLYLPVAPKWNSIYPHP